ncbi:MAG: FAD-dependent oxidoreductase [Clostridia bacterium]|nr:FAD-dependent oxidoreductase [Clostridia bacterium]
MTYDVAIIGAGVTGAMTARLLSSYKLKTVLVEKTNDVAMGASKANSAIVHAGFDAKPGTLKAKLNVKGCAMMPQTCRDLSVPYKNNGSLVVAFSDEEMDTVRELYDRGMANGVQGMTILNQAELRALEPKISDEAKGALSAGTAGIVCPYELTIASTENAVNNGVDFMRNAEVTAISDDGEIFTITTAAGEIRAKYIINAAGCYSDVIARMVGDDSFDIAVRSGEYYVLDRSVGNTVSHTIFQCPTIMGKGILVTPTVDGNLLIGPTADDVGERDNLATTDAGLANVRKLAMKSVPSVSTRDAITSFTGLRAHPVSDDFVIGASKANARFINAAGIESPGLSAAPATAEYVAEKLFASMGATPEKNPDYNPYREAPVRFRHMTAEERTALVKENPAYGRIICRCETITEGEIIDAIKAPAGARDVDGVKRRTRAGMGRCQGGFCGSKVVEILARELDVPVNTITKFGGNSNILYERTK